MQQEYYFVESPEEKSQLEDNAMLKFIFPQKIENFDNIEDIDIERLYFVKDSIPQKSSTQNESVHKEESLNELVLLDDYEAAFNKLGNNDNFNYFNFINTNYDSDNNGTPCFIKNIVMENNCFCPIENEKQELIIKIDETSKKEKISNQKSSKIKKHRSDKPKVNKDYKNLKTSKNKMKRGPYKKKNKIIQEVNTEDKCFPFTKGKGFINSGVSIELNTANLNYNIETSSENISNTELNNKEILEDSDIKNEDSNEHNNAVNNDLGIWKFTTKKYFIASNGKKKRVKKKRKFKPDDIRKKIKARFHKTIKNIINENLKKAGAKELFDFIPQSFIGNVSKKVNNLVLDYTYKEILSSDFSDISKIGFVKVDNIKLERNKRVLKYLEENPDISKRSGFDIVKNMKYKELLRFYFTSFQFENSLNLLKEENECYDYIQEYIYRAKTYIRFFSDYVPNEENKNNSVTGLNEEEN